MLLAQTMSTTTVAPLLAPSQQFAKSIKRYISNYNIMNDVFHWDAFKRDSHSQVSVDDCRCIFDIDFENKFYPMISR